MSVGCRRHSCKTDHYVQISTDYCERQHLPVHSFQTLLGHLATMTRITMRIGDTDATYDQYSQPTPVQQKAFELLGL